jgi:tetratricopeptide (TPR) repeat protein
MRLVLGIALVSGLLVAAAPAHAQGTFEVVGKVIDAEGKGVPGAKLTIVNKVNASVKREGTSDKRGNFYVDGVLYSQQDRFFLISVDAPGLVAMKAKVVGRMGDRTIYDEFERALGPRNPQLEFRVMGIGEVRIEYSMAARPESVEESDVAPVAVDAAGAPSDDPFIQGGRKASAGDFEGAVPLLQQAVEAAPADPERRELLSRVLLRLERPGEALQQALKAVEAAPDRASARVTAADSYATLGNMEKARLQLVEARRLSPDDVKTLQRLARVSLETNKNADAVDAYEAVTRLQPGNVEAWMSLGDLYNQAGQPEKSEAAFKKVSELDPKNAYKTFFNIGALIENREDISEADNRRAIEAFRKAIEIKADYGLAHKHLAYALLRQGDMPAAKKSFERYLDLEPKAPDAAEIRGVIKSLP